MALLLADNTASTLFMLGLLLVVGVVLRGSRKKKSASPPPVAEWGKSPASSEKVQRGLPEDFGRWEVKMHDLARDLSGQLDSKIGILQHLIRDAQQQIDRLEATLARAQGAALDRPPPRNAAPSVVAAPAGTQHRYAEIYSLADAGYGTTAIADQVGSPVGEVELILSLRP